MDNATTTCSICGSFTRDIWTMACSWDNLCLSARGCECCYALLYGCVGWLNAAQNKLEPYVVELKFWNAGAFVTAARKGTTSLTIKLRQGPDISLEIFSGIDENANRQVPAAWKTFRSFSKSYGFPDLENTSMTIQVWLDQCATNHTNCTYPVPRPLPTRLVEVGQDDESIRLIESSGESGYYIALSHCWGPAQLITTTKSTMMDRKTNIPAKLLSKTFHQAIQLTRQLGAKFIWIDSLCIVQDDRDDWAKEAVKMGDYYYNASITLAATSSSMGRQGLFNFSPLFEFSNTTVCGEPYRLIFGELDDHDDFSPFKPNRHPLLSRAWVFQERLLSPRVFHFGQTELLMECIENIRCQCEGDRAHSMESIVRPKMVVNSTWTPHHTLIKARLWQRTAQAYSNLSLSFLDDKFPAIGGLAKRLAQPGSRYCAGLWYESLVDDLLWWVSLGNEAKLERKSSWRAPTWSWANIDGGVRYSDKTSYDWEVPPDTYPYRAEVVNCVTQPKGVDEFGELTSATLQLRGYFAVVKWQETVLGLADNFLRFPNHDANVQFQADLPRETVCKEEEKDPEFVCLLLREGPRRHESLVLKRSNCEKEVYERVGVLMNDYHFQGPNASRSTMFSSNMKVFTIV
ncbi:heterokaryon incompatibility protein-domain-containing protein [Dendryphion nanum]|uniref:Heterokaryon incompatibility protein-domain-containing protein n=1 Tax=Dendryphion nanum TaxID=256645 RepID=A0A9P9I6X2_9PLEO|nr:heterokaryon incompatibility protein-domain-containing protein [Dendryphion nanum]